MTDVIPIETDRLILRAWRDQDRAPFAALNADPEVKGGEPFVGFVGLNVPGYPVPCGPCVEVGWRLARTAWGRGYASEAARACLDFGFGRLGLDEIVSFTAVANTRSRAVMERLGMTHDPADDFDHPRIEAGHPLRRHVLYRIGAAAWAGVSGR